MKCLVVSIGVAISSLVSGAVAATPLKPSDGVVSLHNVVFGDGTSLASLSLHYLTLGTPTRDKSGKITNAVLLLHGTTATADTLLQQDFADSLYGAGQPLDVGRLFLVIPDGIGAGRSSKPSDGLRSKFPHYGYRDQVRTQHQLLDEIGITHLKLVLGTSMGGMQTWLWGEMYPDAMDGLVAIATSPIAISGRNMIWRAAISTAIRSDPDWRNGDYPTTETPHVWVQTVVPLIAIMTGNPEQLQKVGPTRKAAVDFLAKLESNARSKDANDLLYLYESSYDYDPAPNIDRIVRPFLAVNFADDLCNPPVFLNIPKASNYKAVMIGAGSDSYGHMTIAHPARWASALGDFVSHIPGWTNP